MSTWEIVGFIASALSAVQLLPEVIKAWQCKNLDEIAWGTLIFIIVSQILWLGYGINFQLWPVVIASALHGMMATTLTCLKVHFATRTTKVAVQTEANMVTKIPITQNN